MEDKDFKRIEEKEKILDGTCSNVIAVSGVSAYLIERWGLAHDIGIKGKTRIVIEYDNDTGTGYRRIVAEDPNTIPIPKCRLGNWPFPQESPTQSN